MWMLSEFEVVARRHVGGDECVTNIPYFREILTLEPDAAVLVKPGDPIALAQAIHEFFAKPIEVRHEAARRLGRRLAWDKLLPPIAAWLAAHVGSSRRAPGDGRFS